MNTKRNKRGFTIVELVVVIVVIAILAAVLIPTISSLITKANQSADIQAVNQINKLLATHVDGSVTDVSSAIKALAENNIDMDDYRALQNDHYFYFIMNGNTPMVVYCDKDYNVVYPKNVDITGIQLMSLTGEIPTDNSWKTETTTDDNGNTVVTASISSGAQLADFMADYRTNSNSVAKTVTEIKLTSDIDLRGATQSLGDVAQNLTIDGNEHTISGLRDDIASTVSTNYRNTSTQKSYCFGLVSQVKENATVTIKNVNISDVVISDSSNNEELIARSAIICGKVNKGGTLNIENVNIDNCIVYGGDKVGALIGHNLGTVSISNVKVTNTTVLGAGYVAKVIGVSTSTSANVTFGTGENACDFSGITVGVNEKAFLTDMTKDFYNKKVYPFDENWNIDNGAKITLSHLVKCASEIESKLNLTAGSLNSNNLYIRTKYSYKSFSYIYWGIVTDDYYWIGPFAGREGSVPESENNVGYSLSSSEDQILTTQSQN